MKFKFNRACENHDDEWEVFSRCELERLNFPTIFLIFSSSSLTLGVLSAGRRQSECFCCGSQFVFELDLKLKQQKIEEILENRFVWKSFNKTKNNQDSLKSQSN